MAQGGLSKLRTYKEAHMRSLKVSSRTKKREKSRGEEKQCERLESWRAGWKWNKKKHKRKRRELEGLDVMRANIVTEAVHDERDQEGEEEF